MRDGLANLAKVRDPDPVRQVECGLAHARLLWSQGDLDRAIVEATRVRDVMERNDRVMHVAFITVSSMAIVMLNEADRSREALSWSKRYIEVLKQSSSDQTSSMGGAMHGQAAIYYFSGDVRAALQRQHESVDPFWQKGGMDALAPQQLFWLAMYEARAEESPDALLWADRGLARAEKLGNRPAEIGAHVARAQVRILLGRLDGVAADLDAAEALSNPDPAASQASMRMARLARATLLLAQADARGALRTIEALLADVGYPQRTSRRVTEMLNVRAKAQLALAPKDALPFAEEAVEVATARALDPERSADLGTALMTLAGAQRARGLEAESRSSAQRAAAMLAASLGPNHSETRAAERF